MLTCKEQVARSSDFIDGQLSFRERLMMHHHLLFCPNCRRFMRQMRLLQATLRELPEPPYRAWTNWLHASLPNKKTPSNSPRLPPKTPRTALDCGLQLAARRLNRLFLFEVKKFRCNKIFIYQQLL